MLVLVTNEAWFGRSAASAQHDLAARMRAVETHRPIIVASNAGRALIIDRFGRIAAASTAADALHWITGTVRTETELTPYVGYGDAFAFACLGLTVVVIALAFLRRLRPTRSLNTGGGT